MHAIWTNQIADILYFNNKCSYNIQEIMKDTFSVDVQQSCSEKSTL